MVRVPAYGSDGPYSRARALGVHLEAVMGHSLLRGYADADPSSNTAIYSGDYLAGAQGAFAVMTALWHRDRTGEGQLIEIAQAENAAVASQCAYAQGKFDIYADYLFVRQAEWAKTKGTQKFKDYAWWLKLDGRAFAKCLDDNTTRDQIVKDREEATSLHISATPATFVNDIFLDGAVSAADIRTAIESALAQ